MCNKRNMEYMIKKNNFLCIIILLIGFSKIGKTTLIKRLSTENRKYLDLTEPLLRVMANDEPVLFLQRYAPPVLIDNIQYAPELVPVIKH